MKFSESLKKNDQFREVYKRGKSLANKYLVIYVLENNLEINRLGISVSKKVGNSVVRHHLARLIRESYRLHEDMFNSGLDMLQEKVLPISIIMIWKVLCYIFSDFIK